jgi:hypothetical protein
VPPPTSPALYTGPLARVARGLERLTLFNGRTPAAETAAPPRLEIALDRYSCYPGDAALDGALHLLDELRAAQRDHQRRARAAELELELEWRQKWQSAMLQARA